MSIEQAVSAPFATRQLADLGARVIKIERPDGGDFARGYDQTVGGLSSYFVWLNRSKESLTLDLKQPAAQTVLARLLERADVFVQNLAPGAADRLGAATADLRARHPRLITCAVSGYGSAGPYVQKKAYDMLIQAEAGLLSITGTPEAPSRVGISVADIAAGMYAYSGILTALLARATTGAGAALEVSLFDALAEWMGAPAYYTGYGGSEPARSGASHATIAPYELFVSADEVEIYLAIQNAREWSRFCEQVLARPEVAEDPRFATNSDARAASGRPARPHCRRLRRAVSRRDSRSPGACRHRLRAPQLGGGIHQSSAVDGPRLLAHGRLADRPGAGAAPAGADGGRRPGDGSPSRRWGSTASQFSKSWGSTRTRSRPGGRSR